MEAFVADDDSFIRGADAEEADNASFRSEDEPDEEGQENNEWNEMMVLQDLESLTTKRESVAKLTKLWEQHGGRESQINTSTNPTSEIPCITDKTSFEESTSYFISEKHVTSSSFNNSEVHRLRELNERLRKTRTSLTNENNFLKVQVNHLTRKENKINSISWQEEKSNRAEEIEALEEKNESLNRMITDLQDRLQREKNIRTETEGKLWTLERVEKELNLEIKKLKKNIKNKEKMVSQLKEINETEKEQTLETTEITRNSGFNVDNVDGGGIDMGELRKNMLEIVETKITAIKSHYKTKLEELGKTVAEKEAELAKARKENSEHARLIEDYKLQISSVNERLVKAEKLHSEEISRLQKEIQKSKEEINAIKEKTDFHSHTVDETMKVAMETELNIYKTYLDLMEGRIKSHETDISAGGGHLVSRETNITVKEIATEIKHFQSYSHQESREGHYTEMSVSQHQEAKNQGPYDSNGGDFSDEDNYDEEEDLLTATEEWTAKQITDDGQYYSE